MFDKDCFNIHKNGKSCRALVVSSCPVDCSARITDERKYMARLQEELAYAIDQGAVHSCIYGIKRSIKELIKKYPPYHFDLPGINDRDIKQAFIEDTHRGIGGGSSEGGGRDNKQQMKDNRAQETKLTRSEINIIKEETEKFEEIHGKLPKLSRRI